VRFSRILAALCLASPTLLGGQQKPEDVVRAFFKAEDENRWLDAARMLDLKSFERIRRNLIEGVRHRSDFPGPTVESLMRMDPDMPRAVAEYQAAEWRKQMRDYDIIAQDFARVSSVDSLAALSVEDAAARWLEAKGPEWQTERSWRDPRNRRAMNCSGLTDSAAKALQIKNSREPRAVIRGVTSDSGSVSYVVIDVVHPRFPVADTVDAGRGPLPRAIRLRKIAGVWRIEPAADLPNANGMGGTYSVTVACGEGSLIEKPVVK
jgi:hypothetical protein